MMLDKQSSRIPEITQPRGAAYCSQRSNHSNMKVSKLGRVVYPRQLSVFQQRGQATLPNP